MIPFPKAPTLTGVENMAYFSSIQQKNNIAIIGTQWGDEGKGKLVDFLSQSSDIVCRSSGGANAGHTIIVDDEKFVFHLLPSCLLHPQTIALIGNGTVMHLTSLAQEIQGLKDLGLDIDDRIKISLKAHLLFDYHQEADKKLETQKKEKKLGTTGRGIGPAYYDKAARIGIRCEDLLDAENFREKLEQNSKFYKASFGVIVDTDKTFHAAMEAKSFFKKYLVDTRAYLYRAMQEKKKILFEGAQAHHLDIDHGTYPYVTSSSVSIGGVCTGLGVPPKSIEEVIGIVKAYTTRVGEGPFPTELKGITGKEIRKKGHEFGATTGRPRRVGWLDIVMLRESIQTNGIDSIFITKLDILSGQKEIKIATKYLLDEKEIFSIPTTPKALKKLQIEYEAFPGWEEDISEVKSFHDLPKNAKNYVQAIANILEVNIAGIGIGAERKELLLC